MQQTDFFCNRFLPIYKFACFFLMLYSLNSCTVVKHQNADKKKNHQSLIAFPGAEGFGNC